MLDTTNGNGAAPLTASEARGRHEAMVALGTAAHPAASWRTMATLLTEAGIAERQAGLTRCLFDRADDCTARAARMTALRNYSGCVGAGFRGGK